jgi:hypothetical protein
MRPRLPGRSYGFGTMFGSPPGVPGGGITGIRPPPIGGTAIPGSMPAGGHITPLDSESCSLKLRLPVVSLARGAEGAAVPMPGGQSRRSNGSAEGGVAGRSDCASAVGIGSNATAAVANARFLNRMTFSLKQS